MALPFVLHTPLEEPTGQGLEPTAQPLRLHTPLEEAPPEVTPSLSPTHVAGARVVGRPLPGIPVHESRVTQSLSDADIKRESTRFNRRLALATIEGLTMGWGDEAIGALGGLIDTIEGKGDFKDRYILRRDAVRSSLDTFKQEHPNWALGAEIGGSIPTFAATGGMGAARLIPQANVWTRFIFRPMVAGGASGAVIGAGKAQAEQEGKPVEGEIADIGHVGEQAVEHGVTSAVLSGGLGGTARLTGEAGRLGARITRMLRDPTKAAQLRVVDALLAKEPGLTMEQAIQKARDYLAAGGDEVAMLADYRPGQGLARVVATPPGEAQEIAHGALVARGEVAGQRAQERLKKTLMVREDYGQQMVEKALEKQATGPLFTTIRQTPWNPDPGVQTRIQQVLDLPLVKSFYQKAKNIVASRQASAAARGEPFTTTETGILHLTKSMLGERARKLFKPGGAQNTELAATYADAEKSLKWAINEATGGQYNTAMAAYASPARIEAALEEGRKQIFQRKPHEITERIKKVGQKEREAIRLGAIERIGEGQRTDLGSPVSFISSPERLKRLQALSLGKRRQEMLKLIRDREQEYSSTFQRIFRGSKTAEIGAEREVAERIPVETLSNLARGNVVSAAVNIIGKLNAWSKMTNPKQRTEIAKIMFATGDDARAALDALEHAVNNGMLSARNAGRLASMVGRHAPVIGSNVRNP